VIVQFVITLNIKTRLFYFIISIWNLGLISRNFRYEILNSSKKIIIIERRWTEISLLWRVNKVKDLTLKGQSSLKRSNLYWVVSGRFFALLFLCYGVYK
jgi:hypothetical protein